MLTIPVKYIELGSIVCIVKPIVIEDLSCTLVSLPRLFQVEARTSLRVLRHREASSRGSLDYTTTWSQPGSHSRLLQHCTCDVWSLKRRISSLEGLIRSNPTQRLLLGTGIGDSNSGLQQVPWLGVSHFVMCILPTEAQP